MDARDIIVHYHDRTKHHYDRYARSLGYLDWATQPDPFRRYEGCELIPLPPLSEDDTPPFESVFEGPFEPVPVSAKSLSRFFECSLAISAWKQYGDSRWALRVNPSSGNLHPTEGYLIVGPVDGITGEPGVFHYFAREHALERRARIDVDTWRALSDLFPPGSILVGLTSVIWREAWKYGERAFRYCQHDVGHALAALRIAAAMLGWRMAMIESLSDEDVAATLGIDRRDEFAEGEEEHPDLIAAVIPSTSSLMLPSTQDLERVFDGIGSKASWIGKANRLSSDHVPWEAIDWAVQAAGKPRTSGEPTVWKPPEGQVRPPAAGIVDREPSAHRMVRQRRSAVAFDGVTEISVNTFCRILSRTVPHQAELPAPQPPFDLYSWSPRIHLFLFVHRVVGLEPGLYTLVRDDEQRQRLVAATRREFHWKKPSTTSPDLPLYLLLEGNCRQAAAQLSLGQEIAGDGAFSLGMVADFERSLNEFGPWFYRRLFWEAGVVGQVLYLEAEAAGIRATGIGAYFDDPVHELFGFQGHDFQSLYHFTMGGPVHDPRLSTLPAYAWANVFV